MEEKHTAIMVNICGWIESVSGIQEISTQSQMWGEIDGQFNRFCVELGFIDRRGDQLITLCCESLHEFIRSTVKVWMKTPYIWDTLSTFAGWSAYAGMFERDPKRLRNLVLWAYFLQHAVEYLESNPGFAESLALEWKNKVATSYGGLYSDTFSLVKTISLFKDTNIPVDNDRYSVSLLVNVTEAIVQDKQLGNELNSTNGMALLQDLRNRSAQNGTSQNMGDLFLESSWVRLYMVWNMSFSCYYGAPELLCKLFIPAVLDDSDSRWLARRVAALRMTLVSTFFHANNRNWDLGPLHMHFARQASVLKTVHEKLGRSRIRKTIDQLLLVGTVWVFTKLVSVIALLEYIL